MTQKTSKNWFLLLLFICTGLACKALSPATPRPAEASRTPRPTVADVGFTRVFIHPTDGSLAKQLALHTEKALAQGQQPIASFGATWCPPCQAIESTLNEGNSLMVNAFQGTYIIEIDIDEWANQPTETGFEFDSIPIYFKLDPQGNPTGAQIDGGAWGDNIPENMAPPLDQFFHGEP